MPDAATAASGSGRRDRRPPTHIAAEVRKKNKLQGQPQQEGQDALPPPAFCDARKIGGAANFLDEPFEVGDEDTDDTTDWWQHSGLYQLHSVASGLVADSTEHPLAAPRGWARFWGNSYWEYENDPDIVISPFCKEHFDQDPAHQPCQARLPRPISVQDGEYYKRCYMGLGSECSLFVISYRTATPQGIDPERMGFYAMRRLAKQKRAAAGTRLDIPTSSRLFGPYFKSSTSHEALDLDQLIQKPQDADRDNESFYEHRAADFGDTQRLHSDPNTSSSVFCGKEYEAVAPIRGPTEPILRYIDMPGPRDGPAWVQDLDKWGHKEGKHGYDGSWLPNRIPSAHEPRTVPSLIEGSGEEPQADPDAPMFDRL